MSSRRGAIKKILPRKHVGNRTPSHCDRVLVSPEMNKLQYKSIQSSNKGLVQYSDHDAVYALTNVNGLNVLIATWNAGNIKIELPADKAAISHDWADILTETSPDVVFFSLQEMGHKDSKLFYQAIIDLLPGYAFKVAHSNSKRLVAANAYTVSGLIAHRKDNNITIAKTHTHCLEQKSIAKTLLCTKSVIAMFFEYKGDSYAMVGAHFPFKSKDTETWGNDQRIHAMKETMQFILKRNPKYVVLTGDLNFRKVKRQDQLKVLLQDTALPITLKEKDTMFSPTCKLTARKKQPGKGKVQVQVQVGSGPVLDQDPIQPEGMNVRSAGEDTADTVREEQAQFFEGLLKKSKELDAVVPGPESSDSVHIPQSRFHRTSSNMPVNPNQHSWYHHHAPFSQNFGEYVCIKRSTLKDLGTFLNDTLSADEIN